MLFYKLINFLTLSQIYYFLINDRTKAIFLYNQRLNCDLVLEKEIKLNKQGR